MGYAADINTTDYLYMAPVIITEIAGADHVDFPFRLELDSSTFNFDFARSDGKDFRLAERSNGQQVLNMWISSWTTTSATIRFSLPSLLAGETKKLYAFWGNSGDTGISDITTLNALFADDFNTLNTSAWTFTGGSYSVANSELFLDTNAYATTKAANLFNTNHSWTLECKFRTPATGPAGSAPHCIGIKTTGVNAPGIVLYVADTSTDTDHRSHNFWTCGAYAYDPGEIGTDTFDKGVSYPSNHVVRISYVETTDYLIYYMNKDLSRFGCITEYTEDGERVCSGNTRPTGLRLEGRNSSGLASYIDYIVLEKYTEDRYSLDISALYRELENVEYEFSGLAYGPDVTDTYYSHETTLGGDPTKLSDNNLNNVFETTSTEGEVVIEFSKQHGDLTTNQSIHFDNGHVTHFAAVKLSDNDADKDDNYWFQSTTTSGYAAITYSGTVGSLDVKCFGDSSTPKDFRFVGTDDDPRFSPAITLLVSGTLSQSSDWQAIYFSNSTEFDYYVFYFDSTYGDNAKIQEWRMYEPAAGSGNFTAARLKLRPGTLSGTYKYFPKYITFYGNNDLDNWVELIPTRKTYTPDTINWQEYAFTNSAAYRAYKLVCSGNWNDTTDKIIIAEWEINELL